LLALVGCASLAPPIPAVGGGSFRLAWEDNFDRLDRNRWRLMTHSFPTNLARFSTENVRVENGTAVISLTERKADSEKPFRGVEMRSVQAFTYGRVEARARFAKGSGVVSSLVTIYTPWPADDWNELDFECLGAFPDRIQTNAMVYVGPRVPKPAREAVSPSTGSWCANGRRRSNG
jgi:beta-glucanase (GH16 family)